MEMVIRGSEYNSFLTCRKQWFYSWIEGIEPKRPNNKLFFGTLFHKWLEFYYENGCDEMHADLDAQEWLEDQDMSGMEQIDIDELMTLFKGVTSHYDNTYFLKDSQLKVLGTEVEFLVKLEEDIFMTGTIDLVYETPEGKIRFMDHKTVSSIGMYVEKSVMDRQISRYWWALQMISQGIGRIKDKETGLWRTWPELQGKEIDGFDYNLIAKDYPREPKVLKSGKLSQDKSQKTTYKMYLDKIYELGLDVKEYDEMLDFLEDKPDPFLNRVDVKRTQSELEAAAWEFMYTAGDMHDVKLMISENPQTIEPMTYRNIGHHCMNMCAFRSLCQTTIEGGNVSLVKNLGYKRKEDHNG